MRKEYIGVNKEDLKVWGIPFKAGDITKVVIHNIKHTFTYQDSLTGSLRGYDVQIQEIDVYTKSGEPFCISPPQWGYTEYDSKETKRVKNENFKNACNELLSKMEIKK